MKDGISSVARKDEDGTSWESIDGETKGNRESEGDATDGKRQGKEISE